MATPHLDFQQLRRLVESDPDRSQGSGELEHLESCERCQRQLEQQAAADRWWQEAQSLAQVAPADLGSTIEPHAAGGSDAGLRLERHAAASLRDFLDPPRHPEMLGQLNEYEIERVVGRGGMGVVLKGYDRELNRAVAIKVMSPHLAHNATARKRFEREARAAAAVVHPNVIPIHGVSSAHGHPLIVMPFISGRSLQAHVEQQGPLETKDIVRIGIQIAAGLSAAHQQGLIHRDIKPANILIEHDVSRVVITDFGLARAADDVSVTQTGWLAGTPHYMSPEQARGAPLDARGDLFSLGGLLYFLATGREPFRGETPMAVLHKICHENPPRASEVHSDVPPELSDIIESLLEKSPQQRLATAARLQHLLEDYLTALQQPRSRRFRLRLVTRRRRRRRWQMTVLACGVLAASVGAFFLGDGWRMRPEPAAPSRTPISAGLWPEDQFASEMQRLDEDLGRFQLDPPTLMGTAWDATLVREALEGVGSRTLPETSPAAPSPEQPNDR